MGAIVTSGRSIPSRAARLRSLFSVSAATPGGELGQRAWQGPRHRRDWIVDTACFLIAVVWCLLGVITVSLGNGVSLGAGPRHWSLAVQVLVVAAGALACLALWLRRRWPVGVALLAVVLGSVSVAAAAASLIALFSVAIHRRPVVVIVIAALAVSLAPVHYLLYPSHPDSLWASVVLQAAFQAAVVGWGMFIRSRRELMLSLRQRARQAEAERDLRVGQAREQERTRIAREMHDVLAHRISLLSLHAGALEINPDAPSAEIARAAGIVRASAHQALEDLRQVIDVLRTEPAGNEQRRPQPTLADVADLVDESRDAGTPVELEQRVEAQSVPASIGRTVYRIVQEGLTNARKHAPRAAVRAIIDGAPGDGLTVEILTYQAFAQLGRAEIPGAGAGLVGVAERVSLADGHLEHGYTDAGDFRLWAWLPWPA
jgi:signal transduction histidine kinase